ncbi:hypothetical protein CO046_03585 [Candidatus Peregrinibacteria bacterium CG_4_9_14_0_2_um_filter_53_11]|nr:MAG: hypothetical protein CO046_03585 [Candidatus Peregrinibacteria bacterium CG_4_9_14_0_2_um_filter_53_11]
MSFFSLQTETPTFTLKVSSRARRLRLIVKETGEVIVTCPRWISRRRATQFVVQHESWIAVQQEKARRREGPRYSLSGGSLEEYQENKERARTIVTGLIAEFNAHYTFSYGTVRIKNTSSRWGSCSAKGNLNFNYRIAFLPRHLAEYIVVHELCHLKELNHSKRFWECVAETIPHYDLCRAELRK